MNLLDILPQQVGQTVMACIAVFGAYVAFRYWERVRVLVWDEHRIDVILLNAAAMAYSGAAAIDTLASTIDPATPFGLVFAYLGWRVTRSSWDGDRPRRTSAHAPASSTTPPPSRAKDRLMPAIAPTIPPEPTDSDPLEKWVHYRWAVSETNKAAHAEAQAATAAAMLEAARVQALAVEEASKPPPRRAWTQGDVVRMLTPLIPMRVGDTEATYARAVNEQAAKLLPMLNA